MISVRLPKELEESLEELAEYTHKTKTDIVKEAVTQYIIDTKSKLSPYEIGKDLFGQHASGESNRSTTYKTKIKEKLGEKFNR